MPPAVHDFSFTGDHFCSGSNHHAGRYAAHDVRIAGLADSHDAAVANANVSFVDSVMIDDHRVGNDQIQNPIRGSGG